MLGREGVCPGWGSLAETGWVKLGHCHSVWVQGVPVPGEGRRAVSEGCGAPGRVRSLQGRCQAPGQCHSGGTERQQTVHSPLFGGCIGTELRGYFSALLPSLGENSPQILCGAKTPSGVSPPSAG